MAAKKRTADGVKILKVKPGEAERAGKALWVWVCLFLKVGPQNGRCPVGFLDNHQKLGIPPKKQHRCGVDIQGVRLLLNMEPNKRGSCKRRFYEGLRFGLQVNLWGIFGPKVPRPLPISTLFRGFPQFFSQHSVWRQGVAPFCNELPGQLPPLPGWLRFRVVRSGSGQNGFRKGLGRVGVGMPPEFLGVLRWSPCN